MVTFKESEISRSDRLRQEISSLCFKAVTEFLEAKAGMETKQEAVEEARKLEGGRELTNEVQGKPDQKLSYAQVVQRNKTPQEALSKARKPEVPKVAIPEYSHELLSKDQVVKEWNAPLTREEEALLASEIPKWLQAGYIEKSRSAWNHPLVFVRKKSGELRVCLDFRKINRNTRTEAFPLPLLHQEFRKIPDGAQWFAKVDLKGGYWQVPVAASVREQLAFSTPAGKFQWRVMPFGLKNAPGAFQRFMNEVCEGLECIVYLDDMLVWGQTRQECERKEEALRKRLSDWGLKINEEKSLSVRQDVEFLGCSLSKEGLRPAEDKLSALVATKRPRNHRELRSFLGVMNFQRRMIPGMARESAPLYDLLKEDEFRWGKEAQRAFDRVKQLIQSQAVTLAMDPGKGNWELSTDASDWAIGGVLRREGKIVDVFSSKLSPVQARYSTVERELLALVTATQKFRMHWDAKTIIECKTDHQALEALMKGKMPDNKKLCRWLMKLQEFPLQVQYVRGEENEADAWSRLGADRNSEFGDAECSKVS